MNRDLDVVDDVDEDEEEDSDNDNEEDVNPVGDQDEPEVNNEKDNTAPQRDNGDEEEAPELINMDELHIQSKQGLDSDGASYAGGVSISGMSRMSRVSTISYAEAEAVARERVKRHLEERKRASTKKGAFKTRNNNKSYSKGKRVMNDFGLWWYVGRSMWLERACLQEFQFK